MFSLLGFGFGRMFTITQQGDAEEEDFREASVGEVFVNETATRQALVADVFLNEAA